jgi:hypothetical protein
MPEVKLHPDSKGDMAQRIADRKRPSNDIASSDVHAVHGTSHLRTHHTVHHSRNKQNGQPEKGEVGYQQLGSKKGK